MNNMPDGWSDTPLLRWTWSLFVRDFEKTEAGRAVAQKQCDLLQQRLLRAEMVQRFRGRR